MTRLSVEEARLRVKRCNGHIQPRKLNDNWFCDNCGVELIRHMKHKIGFKHHIKITEKRCDKCGVTKSTQEFYSRGDSSDGHSNYCKECRNSRQKALTEELGETGKYLRVWIPKDLFAAMQQLRGRQTMRDFLVQAIRREVEVRTRDIMTQRALEQAKAKRR